MRLITLVACLMSLVATLKIATRQKNMRNSTLRFCTITVVCIVVSGCASTVTEPEPPRAVITFDYTPPAEAIPGSAKSTFAIVGSQFDTPVPLFRTFASNMTKDFGEILTARGFGVRGPFMEYNNLTYSDKEGSDLILTADVKFTSDTSQITYSSLGNIPSGDVLVNCHVNLIVSESLTNERLWSKSVAITPFTVNLRARNRYPMGANLASLLKNENKFYSDVGYALDAQYTEIMNKIYGYLEPKQMAIVTTSARDLRKRKVNR